MDYFHFSLQISTPNTLQWQHEKKITFNFCKFDKNKQKKYNMYRCIQPLLTIMQAYYV